MLLRLANPKGSDYIMARKSGKKLDIATAQVADGALKAERSIYEIVGFKSVRYRARSYAEYQTMIRKMDLLQLHEHSYEVGAVASPSKEITIDRLERKYLQENRGEREALNEARAKEGLAAEKRTIREQAEAIMAQRSA